MRATALEKEMTDQNMDEKIANTAEADPETNNADLDENTGGETSESAKASDDSPMRSLKRFVKNHPLLSTIIAVAIILIFGRTFMGVVGAALIIGGISYLLAVIVYAIFARLSAPKDDDDENSGDGTTATEADAGARRRAPEPLQDLIDAGDDDAKTIGDLYATMMETADGNGGNAELYEAKYSQTMRNVASVIAGKRQIEAYRDRYDDVDEIMEQYRETISGVEDHIRSSIRELNTARTEKIKEDMDVIGKFNEKEL